MSTRHQRRERLHRLIDLALAYRSATRSELAEQLRRDRSRLYAETDNPKLDMIIGLAQALDWSVNAVVEYLEHGGGASANGHAPVDYERLNADALAAHERGDYAALAATAVKMRHAARTADELGRAHRVEGVAWDGQGQYARALSCFREGLQTPELSSRERLALQANMANACYCLWDLTTARGVAHVIIDELQSRDVSGRTDRESLAFALFVRGNAIRRSLPTLAEGDRFHAAGAGKRDLMAAEKMYRGLAAENGVQYLAAIANTCRGALIELAVELNERTAQSGVDEILGALNVLRETKVWPAGDWLESHGWWCDFGANIALRRLDGRSLQTAVAVFTEHLIDIGQRLGNWALIERGMSLDHALRERVRAATGLDIPATLDNDDLKLLAGAIGRFPEFRRVGWDLITNAAIVSTKRN